MSNPAISAAILAAGLSSRMGGTPKALCRIMGLSLLQRSAAALRAGGVERIIVITGHKSDEVGRAAAELGLEPVFNPAYARGMFSSVQSAMHFAAGAPGLRALLLAPVDAALYLPRSVAALKNFWLEQKNPPLACVPSFLSRPGHPILLSRAVFAALLASNGERGGLRGCLEELKQERCESVHELPLPDAGLLADLDRPKDLREAERFLAATNNRALPGLEEARDLLLRADLGKAKLRHCILVALGAVRLGFALARKEPRFACPDLLLHAGAGLVHDIARKEPRHAFAGARILRSFGWEHTALVTACHPHPPPAVFAALDLAKEEYADLVDKTDFPPDADPCLLSAALCVNVADKHLYQDKAVSLEARFAPVKARFAGDATALEVISRRESAAKAVNARLGALLGKSPAFYLGRPLEHPLEEALSAMLQEN